MGIEKRDIAMLYVLGFITCGIYFLYWTVKTKVELNSLGGEIPTAWLLIIPIANLFFIYKYCEAYSNLVKKDSNAVLWFLVYIFAGIVIPAIVQSDLNKLAK